LKKKKTEVNLKLNQNTCWFISLSNQIAIAKSQIRKIHRVPYGFRPPQPCSAVEFHLVSTTQVNFNLSANFDLSVFYLIMSCEFRISTFWLCVAIPFMFGYCFWVRFRPCFDEWLNLQLIYKHLFI